MSIFDFIINWKKKIPFYSENCKLFEWKIQHGAYTTNMAHVMRTKLRILMRLICH